MAATVDVELWMLIDGVYRPALSIPADTCQLFSLHPLTWLRYLGFTIYGVEGHISTTPDGPEVFYYQAEFQPGIHYYVSREPFGPFLLDPDLMDDRTSDGSALSTDRGNFRQRVADRDQTCIMTGSTHFQACHIIPHAKGHQYLKNLVNHRHEVLEPPLNDINDTRNGVLLAVHLHRSFGDSEVAFLQTPNFAMTVNDVDLVTQHNADILGFAVQPSLAHRRLTFQHFDNRDVVTTLMAPHNSDARQSDSDEWPPSVLFDVAYGSAALKTWGVPLFMNFARECTRDDYYLNVGDNENGDGGGDGDDRKPSGVSQSKKPSQQMLDRDARAARREEKRRVGWQATRSSAADSQTPGFADMILALWMHNVRKGRHQARAMKVEKTRAKVQTWLDSTND